VSVRERGREARPRERINSGGGYKNCGLVTALVWSGRCWFCSAPLPPCCLSRSPCLPCPLAASEPPAPSRPRAAAAPHLTSPHLTSPTDACNRTPSRGRVRRCHRVQATTSSETCGWVHNFRKCWAAEPFYLVVQRPAPSRKGRPAGSWPHDVIRSRCHQGRNCRKPSGRLLMSMGVRFFRASFWVYSTCKSGVQPASTTVC